MENDVEAGLGGQALRVGLRISIPGCRDAEGLLPCMASVSVYVTTRYVSYVITKRTGYETIITGITAPIWSSLSRKTGTHRGEVVHACNVRLESCVPNSEVKRNHAARAAVQPASLESG